MFFKDLGIIEPILKAIEEHGYTTPTPIQEQSIPIVLSGKDLFGCAQTGTGKTASFAIPTLQRLYEEKQAAKKANQQPDLLIKALVLTPTRELAIQIAESFGAYGKHTGLRHTVIYGGVGQSPQVKELRKGVDILIATPGRLLDLMNQKYVHLGNISVLILDEADRMLDMGFIRDVKKIVATTPRKRQTLLFSATMPASIMELAHTILKEPVSVKVTPVSSTVETVGQELYYVEKADKKNLLVHLLQNTDIENALVFTKTKHGADKLAKGLIQAGITASAIHGNKSQNARQNALQDLKSKKVRVLVATDIAARGIDISQLGYVFVYDIPFEPETYVHRIGRTGRAGSAGKAIVFCDHEEKKYLKSILKLINQDIPLNTTHPFPSSHAHTSMPSGNTKPAGSSVSRPVRGPVRGGMPGSAAGNSRNTFKRDVHSSKVNKGATKNKRNSY